MGILTGGGGYYKTYSAYKASKNKSTPTTTSDSRVQSLADSGNRAAKAYLGGTLTGSTEIDTPTRTTGTTPTATTTADVGSTSGASAGTVTNIDRTAGIGSDYSRYTDYFKDPMGRYDEIFSSIEDRQQDRIDAINERYNAQVRSEQEAGAEDLARQRSLNLRAGLGGSDFGAANKAAVRDRTNANVATIHANQDIAIGEAINQMETLANQRFQIESTAMAQGFQNQMAYDQFVMQQEEQIRGNALETLRLFGEQGLDMETIKKNDPALYNQITELSGLGEVQAEAVLNQAKKDAQKIDYTYEVVGNKVIGYGLDPVTGEIKQISQELDFEVPTNYSATFAPDGTMMLVPDNWDPSLPPEAQVRFVGNFAQPTTGGDSLSSFESVDQLVNDPTIQGFLGMLKDGTTSLSAIPEEYRGAVALAYSAQMNSGGGALDGTMTQLDLVDTALAEAKKLYEAAGPSAITETAGDWFVGDSDFRRLQQYTNTLQTNILTMSTDPKIREFFGPQMSEADVRMMVSVGTTLDAKNNSPEDLYNEILRLETLFKKLRGYAERELGYNPAEKEAAENAKVGDIVTINGVHYTKLGDDNFQEVQNYNWAPESDVPKSYAPQRMK